MGFGMRIPVLDVVYKEKGLGFFQWQSRDMLIIGGMRTQGFHPPGQMRMRFSAYGVPEFFEQGEDAALFGFVELMVNLSDERRNGEPTVDALIKIEVKKEMRLRGYGERIVAAVAAACPEDLKIYDIRPRGRKFWQAIGAEITTRPRIANGLLRREPELLPTPSM